MYTTGYHIDNIFIEFDCIKLLCFPDRLTNFLILGQQMRFGHLGKNQLLIMHKPKLMSLMIGRCLRQLNGFFGHLFPNIP